MTEKITPTYLSKKNPHPRDEFISFEEGPHIYTVLGERGTYTSVTTWNHSHFSSFNADEIIDKMMKGKNWNDPTYKQMQIDMLKIARKQFRFPSNKLDYVGKTLGVGAKTEHEGFDLWIKCMNRDGKAWKRMEEYNKQDVILLEKVYHRMLPWIKFWCRVSRPLPGECARWSNRLSCSRLRPCARSAVRWGLPMPGAWS